MFSRGGSLLPSLYADARYIDAVTVSRRLSQQTTSGQQRSESLKVEVLRPIPLQPLIQTPALTTLMALLGKKGERGKGSHGLLAGRGQRRLPFRTQTQILAATATAMAMAMALMLPLVKREKKAKREGKKRRQRQ